MGVLSVSFDEGVQLPSTPRNHGFGEDNNSKGFLSPAKSLTSITSVDFDRKQAAFLDAAARRMEADLLDIVTSTDRSLQSTFAYHLEKVGRVSVGLDQIEHSSSLDEETDDAHTGDSSSPLLGFTREHHDRDEDTRSERHHRHEDNSTAFDNMSSSGNSADNDGNDSVNMDVIVDKIEELVIANARSVRLFVSDAAHNLADSAQKHLEEALSELYASHRRIERGLIERHSAKVEACRTAYERRLRETVELETVDLVRKLEECQATRDKETTMLRCELGDARDRGKILSAKLDLAENWADELKRSLETKEKELEARGIEWAEKEGRLWQKIEDAKVRERDNQERISELEKSLRGAERYLEVKIKEVKSCKKVIKKLKDDLGTQTKELVVQRKELRRVSEEGREAKRRMVEALIAYETEGVSPRHVTLRTVRRDAEKKLKEKQRKASANYSDDSPPTTPRISFANRKRMAKASFSNPGTGDANYKPRCEMCSLESNGKREIEALQERIKELDDTLALKESELSELCLQHKTCKKQNDGYRSLFTGEVMGLILAAGHRSLYKRQTSSPGTKLLQEVLACHSADSDEKEVANIEKGTLSSLAGEGCDSDSESGGSVPDLPHQAARRPRLSDSCVISAVCTLNDPAKRPASAVGRAMKTQTASGHLSSIDKKMPLLAKPRQSFRASVKSETISHSLAFQAEGVGCNPSPSVENIIRIRAGNL